MENNDNNRILVFVTPFPEADPISQIRAEATFCNLSDVLLSAKQFETANAFCEYCKNCRIELVPKVRAACSKLKKKAVTYNAERKANTLFNGIEKKRVRVLLYPGDRQDISDLNVSEATHNMIIQFDDSPESFRAAEPHVLFPSFYQVCNSEKLAIKYIEALLVDACMCHYMGISAAALHHDDKQKISKEKVQFLKEIVRCDDFALLSPAAQTLVKYVCDNLPDNTPYISFLSIFTIATFDAENFDGKETEDTTLKRYFLDYCNLWSLFQKWYYCKHQRLFSKEEDIIDPIKVLFNRNKYHGQISPESAIAAIKEELKQFKNERNNLETKETRLYTFVILKNIPSGDNQKICDSLFQGQLRQAKWRIIKWDSLNFFKDVKDLIEIVPFMLEA